MEDKSICVNSDIIGNSDTSKNRLPFVSVVVPCRNEVRYIGPCLDSLLANDYPKDKMEILVIDGMSDDGTRGIVTAYAYQYSFIKLIDNPKKNATAAMNLGVKTAKGQTIAIIGSHATYTPTYLSQCENALTLYNVDNVGGIVKILPRSDTRVAKALTIILSHPFGSGAVHYRIGAKQPKLVDTVFGGCYRREVFDQIGLFNEDLARSQDSDFNIRLRRAGGKILLDPKIECHYYVRSTLGEFTRHVFDDGRWSFYPLKFGSIAFYPRHLVPLAFVSSLGISLLLAPFFWFFQILFAGLAGLYVVCSLFFALQIAVKERDSKYVLLMVVVFGARHFAHGLGTLYGLLQVLSSGQFWRTAVQRFLRLRHRIKKAVPH